MEKRTLTFLSALSVLAVLSLAPSISAAQAAAAPPTSLERLRASIERITRGDLVEYHRRYFTPGNSILAVVGDVTAAEAFFT